jgi:transposase
VSVSSTAVSTSSAARCTVHRLTGELDAARAESRRLGEENDQLRHRLRQLQRMQYGRRSERLDPDQMQLVLEDTETVVERAAQSEKTAAPDLAADHQQKRQQRHTNRGALPAHLPRVHITVTPEHTVCPCCRGPLHVIGEG